MPIIYLEYNDSQMVSKNYLELSNQHFVQNFKYNSFIDWRISYSYLGATRMRFWDIKYWCCRKSKKNWNQRKNGTIICAKMFYANKIQDFQFFIAFNTLNTIIIRFCFKSAISIIWANIYYYSAFIFTLPSTSSPPGRKVLHTLLKSIYK